MEADFQREYHIDLGRCLDDPDFSYRRFLTLLYGFGPESLWHATAEERRKWVNNERAAERAVFSLFS